MLKKILKFGVIGIVTAIVVVAFGLPRLLTTLGLHPHYDVPDMDLSGKRALIITTSHDTLGDTGEATGVAASELTAPYYVFKEAGMEVDVASIKGGQIPIDPRSLGRIASSVYDKRYKADQQFQSIVARSLEIGMVDIDQYDIVFLAGGWGAAYDLGQSETLGEQMSKAYANDAVIGGVCHGPLGLLQAKGPDGSSLIEGRKICAVTDKQIEELGITFTPLHPERDLRAAGVEFEAATAFRDVFAHHVVVDGRLVTGQNQNSGAETAHRMMEVVANTKADDVGDTSESNSQEESGQSDQLTSERYIGTFEFAGGDSERETQLSAIEALSKEAALPMRGMIKKRLGKATEIQDWFAFSSEEDGLTLTSAAGAKLTGDCGETKHEFLGPNGKPASFTRTLSQNDEGLLVLTQKVMSEDSKRTHRYILSESGDSVLLEVSLKPGRLPRALEYAVTYDRKH